MPKESFKHSNLFESNNFHSTTTTEHVLQYYKAIAYTVLKIYLKCIAQLHCPVEPKSRIFL